ncbi:hypothetical protein SAMN05216281_106126 [Cryobacterium luteum]|nr:hypothetical protein SAMN05216281_106126 [Cryobacterium luteum]
MLPVTDLVAVISPSAVDLPPTQSLDITDWVATGESPQTSTRQDCTG